MVAALLFFINPIQAQAEAKDPGWGIVTGYRYIDVDFQYSHDTHEDDSYLPDSQVPGSAGTTEIGGSNWFFLGGRYQMALGERWFGNVDAGMIFGGDEVKSKNSNDVNDANEDDNLFIYSRSSFGWLTAIALNYQATSRLSCGVEGQLTGAQVESGYHRWGSYDNRSDDWSISTSIGPKAGYEFAENFMLETSYHIGKNSDAALTLSYTF